MKIRTESIEGARRLGQQLGKIFRPGDIVCLSGDLGAGKTTLVQAIAGGIGIGPEEYVSSPTFAIMHEYQGELTVYHMDFYRLGSADDVLELGLEEYFYRDGLVLIEWCERAPELIPDSALFISLTPLGEFSRSIAFASRDQRWEKRIEPLNRFSADD